MADDGPDLPGRDWGGGSSGGGGGSAPTTYTQHIDTDGSVTGVPGSRYQISSQGAVTVIWRPPAPKDPEPSNDADNNGYDDRTGLPVGVIRDNNSPSGYLYLGKPVNADGSLYVPGQQPKKTTLYKRPDGGVDLIDEDGNVIKTVYDAPADKVSAGSSFPISNRPIVQGATGGGGGGPSRDYAGEQAADQAFQLEYLALQQEFQAAQNSLSQAFQSGQQASSQDFQRLENAKNRLQQMEMQALQSGIDLEMQGNQFAFQGQQNANNLLGQWGMQQGQQQFTAGQNAQDRMGNILGMAQNQAMQLYNNAIGNNMNQQQFAATYGQNNAQIDLARRNAALQGAALLSQQMSDVDPAAAIAFQAAGGNNIANALAGGGDAISSNALAGAGNTLRTLSQPLSALDPYQWTPQEVTPPPVINVDDWFAKMQAAGQGSGGSNEMPAWLQQVLAQNTSAGSGGGGGTSAALQAILNAIAASGADTGPAVPSGGGSGGGGVAPAPPPAPPANLPTMNGEPPTSPLPGAFGNPQTASDAGFQSDPWTGMFDEFMNPLQAQRPYGVNDADWAAYMNDFTAQQNAASMPMGAIGPQYGQKAPNTTAPHLAPNVGPVTYPTMYTPGATASPKKKQQTTVIPGLAS